MIERVMPSTQSSRVLNRIHTPSNAMPAPNHAPAVAPTVCASTAGLEDESRIREMHLLPAHRARDVPHAATHAVTLVARPVCQREIQDTAATGNTDERA